MEKRTENYNIDGEYCMVSDTVGHSQKQNNRPRKKKDGSAMLFYVTMVALPVLQFAIFYIVVNFKSILFSFQKYIFDENGVRTLVFAGFDNFERIFFDWKNIKWLSNLLVNSFKYLGVNLIIALPFSLLFAYYIFKKMRFNGIYKVMLFLPSVICGMVIVMFYRDFVDWVVAPIFKIDTFWGGNGEKATIPLIVLYLILSFSGNILLFLNGISSIPESIMEAAKIDGASEFNTFFRVVIPSIWGTIVSLLVLAFAELAMGQANAYSVYGSSAPYSQQTFGYYIFNLIAVNNGTDETVYPLASAYGLLATLIIAPVTIIVRKVLLKYGPSEE